MRKTLKKMIKKKADAVIWDDFRAGDVNAQIYLYEAYVTKLFHYGLHIKHDEDLVQDCIQAVFERLIKKREKLGKTTKIEPYLRRCLKLEIFKQLKRYPLEVKESVLNTKEKTKLNNHPDEDIVGESPLPTPTDRELIGIIGQLPTELRDVFIFQMAGCSHHWISKKLGITTANSRKRAQRARKIMINMLQDKR